jgi:hypothetical protein
MAHRRKISTTIASETYSYLQSLVKGGNARNLAQALDLAMARLRRADSRRRLEADTAAYFQGLSNRAASEEARLERALDLCGNEIDFDG